MLQVGYAEAGEGRYGSEIRHEAAETRDEQHLALQDTRLGQDVLCEWIPSRTQSICDIQHYNPYITFVFKHLLR